MYSAVSGAKSEGGKYPYFGESGMFNGNETHRWDRHTLLRLQAAMLEKVKNWAVRSVSYAPREGDGESVGALAGGPLKIGLSFPAIARTQTAVSEYEHLLYIWVKENRP